MKAKISVRQLEMGDEPFLYQMLYYAIYVAEGEARPSADVVYEPELALYVRGWGRRGDSGFIAWDTASQQPAGAAWFRLFSAGNHGYGTVDEDTPELSVALAPGYRGEGLGTELLVRLLGLAAAKYRAISLSVHPDNPAVRLYRRLGFKLIGHNGSSLVMKKLLKANKKASSTD